MLIVKADYRLYIGRNHMTNLESAKDLFTEARNIGGTITILLSSDTQVEGGIPINLHYFFKNFKGVVVHKHTPQVTGGINVTVVLDKSPLCVTLYDQNGKAICSGVPFRFRIVRKDDTPTTCVLKELTAYLSTEKPVIIPKRKPAIRGSAFPFSVNTDTAF